MIWQRFSNLSASMPFQMAVDEILFNRAIENQASIHPMIRFYYASEPWLSLGYSYAGWKQLQGEKEDADFFSDSSKKGLPLCRRITGGGRVVHGNDLMFTIIAPKSADESFKSVRLSYLKIHDALKEALENLGFQPRYYRCDEKLPKGKDCFVFPIASDLALGTQKIAGGGQKRSQGVMLHQESIFLEGLTASEKLIESFLISFGKIFEAELHSADWHPDLFMEAEELAEERYHIQRRQKGIGTVSV